MHRIGRLSYIDVEWIAKDDQAGVDVALDLVLSDEIRPLWKTDGALLMDFLTFSLRRRRLKKKTD